MNIKTVARLAGVSPTTVSRVFSGSAPVDSKTARRVRQAADRAGYIPNRYARALGSGRSRTYGLIISDIANPFFPDLVKAFEQKARDFGYETLVVDTDYEVERMEQCVRRMIEYKVDGVAIMTSEVAPNLVQVLTRRQIPMVFLDTGTVGSLISNIVIDYDQGIRLAIDHLTGFGHNRIAFIEGPSTLKSAILRRDAFRKSMRRCHLPVDPAYLVRGDHTIEGGRDALNELISVRTPPTAVVCSNDLTAVGALSAAHMRGINVPQKLSIVGFDDIHLSTLVQPALTTIRVPRCEIATRAFTFLYGAAHDRSKQGLVHNIPVDLVQRGSTGPVP